MAPKYLHSGEEVLRTVLDHDRVPLGSILVKLRLPGGKPYWETMTLEEYAGRSLQAPAAPPAS